MIKKNSIINDDCFNVFPKIAKKSVDMVLVDLPYGQTDCKWDVEIDLNEMWKQLKLICKENCQYVFFTTTKFGYKIIQSNPNWFRYDLVWEKPSSVGYLSANKMSRDALLVIHIPLLHFSFYPNIPQRNDTSPFLEKYGPHFQLRELR